MEELKKAREETEQTRQEVGAHDVRPGEMEGMILSSGDGNEHVPQKSRALEKRKRDLEERRRLLKAKRRKKNIASNTPEPSDETPVFSMPPDVLENGQDRLPNVPLPKTTQEPIDPFAALEAQAARPNTKGKGKQRMKPVNDADAFLASLEQDIMTGRKKQ